MIFEYQARTPEGKPRIGTLEAPSSEVALQTLQRQNLIIISLKASVEKPSWFEAPFAMFRKVKQKDVMLLSRQLATLFEAKVPVVRTLQTLIAESESSLLKKHLADVLDDIQGGMSMSQAMNKHPQVFSTFFVQMVRAGEESGKLDEVFTYLADYLERSYGLLSKARNALIYPAFIMVAFIGIMIFLFTSIVPKIGAIIEESGQELPFYTKMILGLSTFLVNYGILIVLLFVVFGVLLVRYLRTPEGIQVASRVQLSLPVIGMLYKKMYLARLADNLQTLITGGIPIIRALQITADVVGNDVYRSITLEAVEAVRGGSSIADAFGKHPEVPMLLTQMIRVGEETGKLDSLLKAISRFYAQEVDSLVENLVSLIEPILIVILGLGVGIIVVSVLQPIYNLTASFS